MLYPLVSAADSDVPELVRLRREAEDWLASRGIDQWRRGEVDRADIERQVTGGEWLVTGAPGRLEGGFRLLWSDPEVWQQEDCFAGYVHGLVVDRTHMGKGVGAALLGGAAQRTRAAGAHLLRLDCAESNPALRNYYRALGFREVGRRDVPGQSWLAATLLERRVRTSLPQ